MPLSQTSTLQLSITQSQLLSMPSPQISVGWQIEQAASSATPLQSLSKLSPQISTHLHWVSPELWVQNARWLPSSSD
jgi:hypothetical protein